tara:strand:- start:50 stop:223 length:174 start_codon:yes stop_codon:yes gene_type:complete
MATKCKKCYHDCHCNGDLHADEYGTCACDNCTCKRTYIKQKDHATDMSFENEVMYDK